MYNIIYIAQQYRCRVKTKAKSTTSGLSLSLALYWGLYSENFIDGAVTGNRKELSLRRLPFDDKKLFCLGFAPLFWKLR